MIEPARRFPICQNKPSIVDAAPALDSSTRPDSNATNDGTGATGADGSDAGLLPLAFVAVTVNVCAVPLVNPVTVHDNAAVSHV